MRGPSGGWLVGFRMTTGIFDIFNVKAQVVLENRKLAWDLGFRQSDGNKIVDQLAKVGGDKLDYLVILNDPPHFVRGLLEGISTKQ
ncbi:hypothetical protein Gotri_020180 [Gossypium trilobum]|uniref:Uncharacterized protein n=1 Tax=Gossypium trilobum TaxID=34281 RepID=A0A7J9D8K1_9ROSI|nr:hypothetical protein [Gossypium trilobum]